jgi:hypothetical protein
MEFKNGVERQTATDCIIWFPRLLQRTMGHQSLVLLRAGIEEKLYDELKEDYDKLCWYHFDDKELYQLSIEKFIPVTKL